MAEEMTDAERLYYVLRHGYVNVAIGTDVCLVAHRDGHMSDEQLDAAIALIDDKIRSERLWGAQSMKLPTSPACTSQPRKGA